ncbi:sensor histidine kinase [Parafilimonas sp.]|uniref:sensor histidine kinase n=1 Tax=Parafilimonas sp. TaxID=1969739 RepID=UPI0039E37A6C
MYPNESKIYTAILIGALVLVAFMVLAVVTIYRYHRKKISFQRERIRAEINSLEEERKRIATDLHDDFGASLSAIKLRLQCFGPDNIKNIALGQGCEFYIDEAMRKLKRISFNMMPQILHRNGLKEALTELIDMLNPGNITINFTCEVNPGDIEKRVHIYRIIQEIINNTVRHSNASSVTLSIEKIKNKILLHIEDNGIGFDKNLILGNKKGEGLQNIRARAELLNAKVHLKAIPGMGVNYIIKIPA